MNALSGTTRASPRRKAQGHNTDDMCNDTIMQDGNDAQRQLMEDSIQVLHLDWDVHTTSHKIVSDGSPGAVAPKKSRSTRANLMTRASKAVGKTSSVLGKRGRDVVEASAGRIKGLTKRANLRPRGQKEQTTSSTEQPANKRARTANSAMADQASDNSLNPISPLKPKVKRWLSQGLYVGQDATFDPRYNTTQNQKKKAMSSGEIIPQRKILPLPMFLGKKTLEIGRDFVLPWDVFHPLPSNQPKPEEWRKTRKSTENHPTLTVIH